MRLKLVAAVAVLSVALASCSSGKDDKKVASTNTTDKSTTSTSVDPSTSSSSTSIGGTTTTGKKATATTTKPVVAAPGTTGAPAVVDKVAVRKVATLSQPLAFTTRPGDASVYIGEKGGAVKRLEYDGTNLVVKATIINISGRISTGGEQGLLGIAFSPDGSKLYIDYTNKDGDTRVAEYPYNGTTANVMAERIVLGVGQPYPNHNGGHIVFGPDGMLYVGLGDGGSGGDPQGNGQNLNSLLGKILRINPNQSGTAPYSIPAGNPFAGQAGKRAEIWHYGLRNPWRFSFDRANGEQWIGDVGQDEWEEINHVAAGAKGLNFGWNRREGSHAYKGGGAQAGDVGPVYELPHPANCSITGGVVYRGNDVRGLAGTYLFTDTCGGKLLGGNGGSYKALGPALSSVVAFGEDSTGEVYMASIGGDILRLVRG